MVWRDFYNAGREINGVVEWSPLQFQLELGFQSIRILYRSFIYILLSDYPNCTGVGYLNFKIATERRERGKLTLTGGNQLFFWFILTSHPQDLLKIKSEALKFSPSKTNLEPSENSWWNTNFTPPIWWSRIEKYLYSPLTSNDRDLVTILILKKWGLISSLDFEDPSLPAL